MTELIEQIRVLAHRVSEALYYYRRQNYGKASKCAVSVMEFGEAYMSSAVELFPDSVNLLLSIWQELLEATERGNELQLADLYEQQLLPALYQIQGILVEETGGEPISYWESNMSEVFSKSHKLHHLLARAKERQDRAYGIGWALTGDMWSWVQSEEKNVQMHSTVNPWQEALAFVEDNVSADKTEYVLFGIGLGYVAQILAERVECDRLVILEHDLEQLRIAMNYTDLGRLIADPKVTIIYEKEDKEYASWLSEETLGRKVLLWYPSVKTVESVQFREALENFWVQSNSIKNMQVQLQKNFYKNRKLQDESVWEIQEQIQGKTMYLVAGGPSLDKNMALLSQIDKKQGVIFCVGKVAKKLLSSGIRPDYIVVIDGKPGTRWQMDGIEDCQVPLIYLATAAWNVTSDYQGKRYIAFQKGFECSEEYAVGNGIPLFETGGSVATFALDMGIRMGCLRIVCIGLDMGYPGGKSHADGVGRTVIESEALRNVTAVGGGIVRTGKTLDIYRKWIEQRIHGEKEVKFINVSEGARIHGMEEMSLEKAMQEE